MRVLVCGGRDYHDVNKVYSFLDSYYRDISVLITGHATGADQIAEMWADENDIENEIYPANWKQYGRRAGYLRNKQMLDEGKPDLVVAFPGGPGTAMMVKLAEEAGVKVIKID